MIAFIIPSEQHKMVQNAIIIQSQKLLFICYYGTFTLVSLFMATFDAIVMNSGGSHFRTLHLSFGVDSVSLSLTVLTTALFPFMFNVNAHLQGYITFTFSFIRGDFIVTCKRFRFIRVLYLI
jgi:hypothetical protein